ncbi:LANO_0H03510g1_1 [Lachancea nothofagi CBS 11611]|uniref:Deoxycytidylate deaminase n=1 Tax=Lachancea nothofagi CBS 11611 TaxID=1266666 RepID=A0A1G4KL45_9SACH|nr:LANO_0H03510g1_1 [Lachancea nothofagi CBS 11611]
MLIYVSENLGSGAGRLLDVLKSKFEFEELPTDGKVGIEQVDHILEHATSNYTKNFVFKGDMALAELKQLEKRPFFLHITIDAALRVRVGEWSSLTNENELNFEKFLTQSEAQLENSPDLPVVLGRADVKFYIRNSEKLAFDLLVNEVDRHLKEACQQRDVRVPFHNTTPLRPDWDTYFMKLATLAASRSNCMKRRVGCVIVRDCRVIATGYNGTPRHLVNCHSGGCPRCNSGNNSQLSSCLCLHAEENALLEAGRDRVGPNAILYCDTCPCLTCSVKIVQTGVREVVYSQSYRMDEASFKVLQEGGVLVRQFSFLEEPRYSVL